jgi:hypothetical protein
VSKARKAKTLRGSMRQTVLEPRRKMTTGSRAGTTAEGQQEECWDFRVVDPTPVAERALTGITISGQVISGRVAVSASFGLIGFAPPRVGQKIIEVQSISGGTLAGAVTSSGTTAIAPSVRICCG